MDDSIKEQVKQQFSQNALNYITSPHHAQGEDLALLVTAAHPNETMRVLDIATGGGHVANALAPFVHSVTACDITETMLNTAASFIRNNGHVNVDFVVADAEALPFADDSFDLVTCRIAAHHFADVPKFVHEAFRVLQPGGKFQLIDNVAPEEDRFEQFYNRIEKLRDYSHVRVWKKSEWITLLESAGFRLETAVCFPKPFHFRSWCERAGLPQEEQDKLESVLREAPADMKRYFSIQEDAGRLVSFHGESVYFQAGVRKE